MFEKQVNRKEKKQNETVSFQSTNKESVVRLAKKKGFLRSPFI